jgi:hypothetical protein
LTTFPHLPTSVATNALNLSGDRGNATALIDTSFD